jgi:hypothetical protein
LKKAPVSSRNWGFLGSFTHQKKEFKMKPEKNDKAVKIKISGRQLEELQRHTGAMCESFGLDNKVFNYKGVRPISFYSWDLDCLLDVIDAALKDPVDYPDHEDEGYLQLCKLRIRLKQACQEIYGQ